MSQTKQILIAEDDNFMRTLLEAQCRNLGMQTHAVPDGAEAVTEALSYQYDILLMDIQMPVCDGLTAMHMLRRLGYDRPIFAMSADDIEDNGFNQVLPKPVDIQLLASLLQQTPQHKSVDLVLDSELTKLFYQNLQQLSIEFNQALSTGQRETLRRICHKIKGGAASFGETTLAELAAKLQQQLLSDIPMDALKHSCQYFAEFIQQFGDRNA
ncbi:MAG TPA: response regulator [Rheinheimera sp.]|uniref:response regulator n=1 Tax=Rheinheimera sp. TaxID=1869214 RepID=UPI002F921408